MTFKHYDDKQSFDAWMQTGSIPSATKYLIEQGLKAVDGISNPHTTTVYMNAIRYIINNPEEARPVMIKKSLKGHQYKNDKIWEWKLIKWAKILFTTSGRYKGLYIWLIEHGLDERAKELGIINPNLTVDGVLRYSKG